jgi:hypothetical protein
MKKIINPGKVPTGKQNSELHIRLEYTDGRLRMSGVVGALSSGNGKGISGQCHDSLKEIAIYKKGWDKEKCVQLFEIWKKFHLNDMHEECEHQAAAGWLDIANKQVGVNNGIKSETKSLRLLKEDEHPDGILCKPCPVCGYKYGTAWNRVEVPESVIKWLFDLPDAETPCAWNL